ncbi:MAG TPA: MarR family transcriptional regulator [Aliiroseovarius sp.]|nr:MarR family transcriptional regulator [Aliiroseovarius sp.]
MIVSAFNLETFLPYQLAVLSQRVSQGFSRHYRDEYGISVAEWRVVAHLSQESAVSVREICRRVDMDKPKVSRAASRLEDAGYVIKKTNPQDRRLVELSLTSKGRQMVSDLTPRAKAYEDEILSVLGAQGDEFRALVKALVAAKY